MLLILHVVFMCLTIILKAYGQYFEFQPSFETQRFQNSSRNFFWRNCDSNSRALNFTLVDMKPDPLLLTGENLRINLTLGFNLTTALGANGDQIEVDLSLRLKTPESYTEICGLVGENICHYNDLCKYSHSLMEQCKKYNITVCHCPFKPMMYILPVLSIPIDSLPFLLKGTFAATVFVKQQGKHVGCLDIRFCVTECMF